MTPEEQERRTRQWTEVIDRGLAEEGYRQDPRSASSGHQLGPNPIVTYVTRRKRTVRP